MRMVASIRMTLYAVFLFILALLFLAGAELILRHKGIMPWRPAELAMQVTPGGRLFMRDPALGYSHIPGRFAVTERGYTFTVTNLPNTLRVTHGVESNNDIRRNNEMWILGCSFTYGWSVNDDETYPWLLQQRFPEYEVVNFGVSGYGTIHSLLQFREGLKTRTPRIAVLAYAGFHDARNTFARARRKEIVTWNRLGPLGQPYARLDASGKLQYLFGDVWYREFPLMRRLAVAHYVESLYDRYELKALRSHAISEALVADMAELAKLHGVTFILANIEQGEAMLSFAERQNILNVDISVDRRVAANTNLPYDSHPSALAHRQYADKLERFLRLRGLDRPLVRQEQ